MRSELFWGFDPPLAPSDVGTFLVEEGVLGDGEIQVTKIEVRITEVLNPYTEIGGAGIFEIAPPIPIYFDVGEFRVFGVMDLHSDKTHATLRVLIHPGMSLDGGLEVYHPSRLFAKKPLMVVTVIDSGTE